MISIYLLIKKNQFIFSISVVFNFQKSYLTANNKLTSNPKINIDKSFLLTSIPNQIIPRYSKRRGKTYDNEQEQRVHDSHT